MCVLDGSDAAVHSRTARLHVGGRPTEAGDVTRGGCSVSAASRRQGCGSSADRGARDDVGPSQPGSRRRRWYQHAILSITIINNNNC